jgi:DNA-binding response OmpR family regulator
MGPRVLIIDDSEDFRLLVGQYIAVEWPDAEIDEWDPVANGDITDDYKLDRHDVILLDFVLGKADGLDWLKRFNKRADCPPVIFLTGAGSEQVAVQALKNGAVDYLRKNDLSKARLVAALREVLAARDENADTVPLARTTRIREATAPINAGQFSLSETQTNADVVSINGYRVLRKIGAGGMSTVYLAERLQDNQQIVMKILDAKLCEDNEFLMRFIQEYGLISKLESPYVVRIFDQGFTDRHVYIAMEYFANGDLRARMKRGVTPTESLMLLENITLALEAIHAHGIIHRDLKPENIMFRADDSLAIVDFGIAKQVSDASSITQAGHILGTPYYLSPEQAKGETLDERSDLYSTGIMLFEMLARRRPFQADTPIAMVHKHINEPIPRLPAGLERFQELVDCLMAKDPASRFANARSLADYIAELKTQ